MKKELHEFRKTQLKNLTTYLQELGVEKYFPYLRFSTINIRIHTMSESFFIETNGVFPTLQDYFMVKKLLNKNKAFKARFKEIIYLAESEIDTIISFEEINFKED